MNSIERLSVSAVLTVAGILVWMSMAAPRASAIPAFSRKYQTSCSTCHSNYPELNDFGEAFKKNGFKFPKDDETFVKEPPVLLGAKAQKEAFPKAVYPGEIPGSIPVAFRYSGNFTYNSRQPVALGFLPRTDLFAPNTFTVIGAGSFGPTLSFWVDNDISAGGDNGAAGLGDGYLKFNDLGHYLHLPKDALNVRMGQFEVDLPFSQARSINLTPYDVYGQASIAGLAGTTNNPFVFGIPQRGFEVGGYPNDGNFSWSVAMVNGSNNSAAMRNTKDVYVRVSQRFNLERDASARKEVQAAGPTGPRDHSSLRLGSFYYYGENELNLDDSLVQGVSGLGILREPFYRVGGDLRFKYRNLELYGLGMYGQDQNSMLNEAQTGFQRTTPVLFTGGFAQAQYWVHPWVIALMRYDFVRSPMDLLNGFPGSSPTVFPAASLRNRFSPGVQFLVRANIKLAVEYQHRWQQSGTPPPAPLSDLFRPNGFQSGIDFVF
jgi:hypothetical protein